MIDIDEDLVSVESFRMEKSVSFEGIFVFKV